MEGAYGLGDQFDVLNDYRSRGGFYAAEESFPKYLIVIFCFCLRNY
jgi:hypothetical protein